MADFPALDPAKGSYLEVRDGRQVDYAGDGTARIRKLHGDKGTFRLKFELTAAQRNTLISHYGAHMTATFNFAWVEDGATYAVRYARRPTIKPGEVERRDIDVDLVIMS